MSARRGNLERALGHFLALDLFEVWPRDDGLGLPRRRRRQERGALEMREQAEQVARRKDLDLACPGRLGPLHGGADQSLASLRGMKRGEQDAGRGRDPPVERQFADRDIMAQHLGIGRADRGEQAERDREVEVTALLGQVGRREIDRDDLGRQRETDRGQRGTHPLAAFGHCLVGQADDDETRDAG